MTEAEWLTCSDPDPMLETLRERTSQRKLRLFAAACCRRIWHLLDSPLSRRAVEVAEDFADGKATRADCSLAEFDSHEAPNLHGDSFAIAASITADLDVHIATSASIYISGGITDLSGRTAAYEENCAQAAITRDIIGPLLFRQAPVNLHFRTGSDGAISKLAQLIYDGRAFDRLPLLADALEEAGCDNQDILDHCRSTGEHVRGCWAVDLILGKS